MKIKSYDGLTRYLVESDTQAGTEYLVDLLAYAANGWCNCPHFRIRLEPKIGVPQKIRTNDDTFRCKHIIACREKLAGDLLNAFVEGELKKGKKKQ